MAYYDDRQYSHHDRYSRPPPAYGQDPYYYGGDGHGSTHQQTDMVRRHETNEGSAEGYYRGHPAGDRGYEYGYGNPPRSRRSDLAQEGIRRSHSMGGSYDNLDHTRSRRRRSKRHDDRYDRQSDDRQRDRYKYSPPSSRSPSPSRQRRKSLSEQALNALGLGSKHQDMGRGRSHTKDRRSYSESPSPSRGSRRKPREKSEQRIAQAVRAAVTAGAVEAFRTRKDRGEWTGEKGKRVLTAALTAAGTDGLVDRDPKKHSKRHVIESALAGLAANRMVNGSRSKSTSKSRGRGRSHSRGGAKDFAAAGLLATAGKELYDRARSRSRSRPRRRSSSRDDSDYYERPRRHKKRSKSVTDYINQGMEALGFAESDDRRRRTHRSSRYDDYSDDSRHSDYDSRYRSNTGRTRHSRDVSRPYYSYDDSPTASGARGDEGYGRLTRSALYDHDHGRRRPAPRQNSSSDGDNSTDEKEKNKRLTREMLVTSGLATVATIHAAHSIHGSMEKHRKRVEMLKEGEITPEEARRRRIKAQIQDTANVGMAALGIQGAISEWKHAEEKRRERAVLQRESKEKRAYRDRRARSLTHRLPRTMLPDEIEENFSHDNTSRSIGRSSSGW